jgi:hypothetical protein
VFAMAGGTEPEPVWELVGYTHDTDDLWDLGQVKIPLASQVSSKYFFEKQINLHYFHLVEAYVSIMVAGSLIGIVMHVVQCGMNRTVSTSHTVANFLGQFKGSLLFKLRKTGISV